MLDYEKKSSNVLSKNVRINNLTEENNSLEVENEQITNNSLYMENEKIANNDDDKFRYII